MRYCFMNATEDLKPTTMSDSTVYVVSDINFNNLDISLAEAYPDVIKYESLGHNSGIVEARNKGLSLATKKYITFVDQDDSVRDGYSSFIQKMEAECADVLIANYYWKKNNEIIQTEISSRLHDKVIRNEKNIKDLILFLVGADRPKT